jgi:hypothetical protein
MATVRPNRKFPVLITIAAAAALTLAAITVKAPSNREAGLGPAPGQMHSAITEEARFPNIRHPKIGFATQQKFLEHYDKHGREFGRVSSREYLLMAQDLRDGRAGQGVLEFTRRDGVVTRFDHKSGAFLAFNRNLTIRTFFKPNDGEAYFKRQQSRESR